MTTAAARGAGSGGGGCGVPPSLRDGEVPRALAVVHRCPAHPWTLEDLARESGTSRATLSRRFARAMGKPPLTYLTRWRIDLAAAYLREGDEPLPAIARRVGYTSPFALSRAFTRIRGIAPSHYRAAHRVAEGVPRACLS
ncbi:helix-turn-helix transcriptional regulator [Streptomyces axinellae]|uniref:HTH araC/xylS-type domain-containing protein n=1 Tax=Streptomyces axinellae TaxID=552788 RepID=A0ABP6CEX7_9ACTN